MATIPEPPSDPDRFLDALTTYLQAADPQLVSSFKGASAEDIGRYMTLSRAFGHDRPVPALYAAFLRRMGAAHGRLFAEDQQLDATLGEVLEMYEDYAEFSPEALNPRLPICGRHIISDEIAFDLDTDPRDPVVVPATDGRVVGWLSQSWAHLMVQVAVPYVERRRRERGRWFSSSAENTARAYGAVPDPLAEARARLDALLAQLDVTPAWPSDLRNRLGMNDRMVVIARIGDHGEPLIQVFSDDPGVFAPVADFTSSMFGARAGDII